MRRLLQKPEVTVGLVVGAILTLAIAGSLELFIPMSPGGWSEAVRSSIRALFGHPWEEVLALQIALGLSAILITTALGSLIGALFSLLISSFFKKMFEFLDKHDGE